MHRKTFIKNIAATFGALALSNFDIIKALAPDPFTIKMLNDTTGIFSEKGGTILFQLNKKGIIVVDTQFADTAAHLIEQLKNKSKKAFKLLVNTHHHGDHTSGNIAFKGIVDTIVAHKNSLTNQKATALKSKNEDKQLYATETFDTNWSKKIGKEKITLHYFGAGHTNGDAIVHFEKANIVHMGDLVFNRRHPYIDRPGGANIANWITVLEKTVTTFNDDTKFICGHCHKDYTVEITKADISAFANYLKNVLNFVSAEIKAGKTKAAIFKATEIPGSEEWKGDGIERPLTAAYEELTANT
jgi:cyclase